jgi:hypothetical protein
MLTKDELWPQLDRDGENVVREKLATEIYGHDCKPLIQEWLRRKEEERSAASSKEYKAMASEHLLHARSAKNAAWIAAVAAMIAIVPAIAAVIISIIALLRNGKP